MNGAKNLIMGLWVRQSFRALEKFIASLRHTTFAGDVCLCVEDISADTVAQLRAHGIIVVRTGPSAQPRMTALASRYFTFLDFLTRHANDYVKVMLTEPAAVVFQSDPFAAPLPADIVYTSERRLLCKSPAEHGAVVQAYGESVAHNIRDCMVSNTSATIGTFAGILRYVVAMTHELSGRTTPISGLIDQGVHNYVVHMHTQRGAWLDPAGSIAVAMHTMPDEAVRIAEQGVLIDGRLAPVLCRWDGNSQAREYVKSAPRFRLDPSMRRAWPSAEPTDVPTPPALSTGDAVVAFYQRQRDADWLQLFLGSLRCVPDATSVHCVGDFDDDELAVLARYGCTAHQISASESGIAENVAHFYLNQVLEKLTADRSELPDQVLVLDNMSAAFLRDPFLTSTDRLVGIFRRAYAHRQFGLQPTSVGVFRAARGEPASATDCLIGAAARAVTSGMRLLSPIVRGTRRAAGTAQHPEGGPGCGQQTMPRRQAWVSRHYSSKCSGGAFRLLAFRHGCRHQARRPHRWRGTGGSTGIGSEICIDEEAEGRP